MKNDEDLSLLAENPEGKRDWLANEKLKRFTCGDGHEGEARRLYCKKCKKEYFCSAAEFMAHLASCTG